MKKPIDFEDYLQEKHADQFIGTKDVMVDDFDRWLEEIGIDGLIEHGQNYGRKVLKDHILDVGKQIREG